jgi:hypothetical protein
LSRREKLFWLSVGFVFVIGFLCFIPAHYEICEVSEKTHDKDCTSYQLVPFIALKIPQILDRMGGVFTALATIAIAWFTFALKKATDRLWDAGERQLKFLADSSAAQSRDMQGSIAAAQEANRISHETAVQSRRAWLSVEDVKFIHPTEFREDGFVLRVSAKVKNFGSTPATGVWLDFTPFISEAGERYIDASARVLARARAHPPVVGTTIFPQDTLVIAEVSGIGSEHFAKSIKPRPDGSRFGTVILFVTASYQVLGDPVRRVTHHSHSYLNARVGLKVTQGNVIDLPADPFSAGTID